MLILSQRFRTLLRRTLGLPLRMASVDLRQARESVRRIAQLDIDILCFGHGRPLTEDIRPRIEGLLKRIGG